MLPLVDLLPVQEPLAVHAVAPVVDQLSVALPPELMVTGLIVMVTSGITVTVAEAATPLQVRV